MIKEKSSKYIFDIPVEDKKLFKAMCARSGLSMSEVLNDFIKQVMEQDLYELKNK